MKIQLWKRKNYSKNRYNLYIRYRINQNKAKVESLNLWEWISPKGKVETKHNYEVKIACDEILRRTRDDIENGRSNINIDQSNDYSFKNAFFFASLSFLAFSPIPKIIFDAPPPSPLSLESEDY